MAHNDADEVRELRRSLRDVIALTTLTSIWSAFDAAQIAADAADVVARMLDAAGVYVTGAPGVLRLRRADDEEAERCLREAAARPNDETAGELRVLSYPLSVSSNDRLIVAARRADFPTERERLIARVAANQAAVWLHWKHTEAALGAESAFRAALESSMLAGVAVVDANGRQTYVNHAFAAMVGWPEEELIGKTPPFVYWAPEDFENINAALQEVIAGRSKPAGYELRFRRSDHTRFDVQVLISSFAQPGGTTGFVASVYDITKRKASERNAQFLAEAGEILSRSLDFEETLRAVTALAVPRVADWCFVDLMEADGSFRRTAVACPRPELEPLAARLQRSYVPKPAAHGVSHTFARGETVMMNDIGDDFLVAVARDADHLATLRAMHFRALISVPMKSRGSTFGVMTFIGSEQWQRFEDHDAALAEELARRAALAVDNARLYRSAQDASRAKDDFLATLSHELRTPMTAILGWSRLLKEGHLDSATRHDAVETILRSAQAQATLIDDVLDMSRIIAGKMQIDTQAVDITAVAEDAMRTVQPAAEGKGVALELQRRQGSSLVTGDANRLQQIVWNLLSNAIKFTPRGGEVVVRIEQSGSFVRIIVRDSGNGIRPEFLPHIFEPFRQGENVTTRVHCGIGLGLAIVKQLVELHGGRISAESAGEGKGATFTIELPVRALHASAQLSAAHRRAEAAEQRAEEPYPSLHGMRVLFVDDQDDARLLVKAVLNRCGATVVTAASVQEAFARLAEATPDVIVSDIAMPEEDGFSLMKRLRNTAAASVPVVAMTAFSQAADRQRILDAGFCRYLKKPVEPHDLAHALYALLHEMSAS